MHMMTLDPWSRWSIERRISSAGREAARRAENSAALTSHYIGRRIDNLEENVRNQGMELRTDMIEGLGKVAQIISESGEEISDGIVRIEREALKSNRALAEVNFKLDTLSMNVREGFSAVIDRLESIEGTLERLEKGIMNPEETRAYERYRRARLLLDNGRVEDAMENIEMAIANDGGFPLTHIPEIRALRGALHLGVYDTEDISFLNLTKAAKDFEEASLFSKGAARLAMKERAAFTHELLGHFDTSLKLYDEIISDTEEEPTGPYRKDIQDREDTITRLTFLKARCFLEIGKSSDAADLVDEVFRKDLSYALEAAADPICQEHPDLFTETVEKIRLDEISRCRAALGQLPDVSVTKQSEQTIAKVQELLDVRNSMGEIIDIFVKQANEVEKELVNIRWHSSHDPEIKDAADSITTLWEKANASIGDGSGVDVSFLDQDDISLSDLSRNMETAHLAVTDLDRRMRDLRRYGGRLRKLLCPSAIPDEKRLLAMDSPAGKLPEAMVPMVGGGKIDIEIDDLIPKRPSGFFAGRRYDKNFEKIKRKAERDLMEIRRERRDIEHIWAREAVRAYVEENASEIYALGSDLDDHLRGISRMIAEIDNTAERINLAVESLRGLIREPQEEVTPEARPGL